MLNILFPMLPAKIMFGTRINVLANLDFLCGLLKHKHRGMFFNLLRPELTENL